MGLSSSRAVWFFGLVVGAALTTACHHRSSSIAPAPVSITAADDDVHASLLAHHRYHHHGGLTLLVVMSLDTLEVPSDKRDSIGKIQADLRRALTPSRADEQRLTAALADAVAANELDDGRIGAATAEIVSDASKADAASAAALNRLHEMLTPGERASLVQKVSEQAQVWRRANADVPPEHSGWVDSLRIEPPLTEVQQDAVRANLVALAHARVTTTTGHAVANALSAFGDAFMSDTFDARNLDGFGEANGRMAAVGAAHLVALVQAVSPVLTASQRAFFASELRYHATHDDLPAVIL